MCAHEADALAKYGGIIDKFARAYENVDYARVKILYLACRKIRKAILGWWSS